MQYRITCMKKMRKRDKYWSSYLKKTNSLESLSLVSVLTFWGHFPCKHSFLYRHTILIKMLIVPVPPPQKKKKFERFCDCTVVRKICMVKQIVFTNPACLCLHCGAGSASSFMLKWGSVSLSLQLHDLVLVESKPEGNPCCPLCTKHRLCIYLFYYTDAKLSQ